MHLLAQRWRLLTVAFIAAVSVLFFSNNAAFAAEPGESNGWTQEIENNVQVYSDGDMSEARDPNLNTLVQVWHGWTDNNVYMAVNHGRPVQLPNASTYVTPVVAFDRTSGSSSVFRVFHTGTNGYVFYSNVTVSSNLVAPSLWYQVPRDVRTPNNRSVSVTSLPSRGMLLAYRGQDSDNIYGVFYSAGNDFWDLPVAIPNATSDSSPALSYEPEAQIIVLAWRGTDNQVNIIRQTYGSGSWWGWDLLSGVLTDTQPAVAMTNNGRGQVAIRQQGSQRIQLASIYANGGWYGYWSAEVNGFIGRYGPVLVAYAATVYLLATSGNGGVWWKQSRQF
ncbi:hypothetical protein [Kitasatospora phosalacinea]|uniref:hypothetical protein n=1 Tax=Kitasatospora phosalacinea TaxID=2065 RepID=UPI000527A90A|nr:hypothetical protein [Kitasatospora phosalacinea]